jgi:hypothetical protein
MAVVFGWWWWWGRSAWGEAPGAGGEDDRPALEDEDVSVHFRFFVFLEDKTTQKRPAAAVANDSVPRVRTREKGGWTWLWT